MEYVNEKLEEFNQYLNQRKVAIIGAGVSNLPLLDYMAEKNARVTVFEKKEMNQVDSHFIEKMNSYQMASYFGEECMKHLEGFDIIFRSPSCRPDTPEIIKELQRGAILTSEIEMVMEICPGTIIGVTGSDGKSTTTSLIYEMIKKKGYSCYLGGNIGIPLFAKLPEMTPEDIVVLELSSFQLMDMQISPKIAVVTNVSPNHLDIHKSYEEYIEAKENIFKYQSEEDILILNYDNEVTREMAQKAKGKVIFFSSKTKLTDGYILDNDIIKLCENKLRKHLINTKSLLLRGKHNYENLCAALAATATLVDSETAIKAVSNFKGIPHRLEYIKEINGAKWYNDSIASSPTRTIAGLNSFNKNIILIAGGYDKHLDYTPIAKPIVENVKTLILVGATAEKIYHAVNTVLEKENKQMDMYMCDTLEQTIQIAHEIAKPGNIVLFSPASASFDMFKNFEERGNRFKELVNKIED